MTGCAFERKAFYKKDVVFFEDEQKHLQLNSYIFQFFFSFKIFEYSIDKFFDSLKKKEKLISDFSSGKIRRRKHTEIVLPVFKMQLDFFFSTERGDYFREYLVTNCLYSLDFFFN